VKKGEEERDPAYRSVVEETAGREGGVWVWGQAAVELRLVKARTGPLVSLSLADALAAAAHLSLFSFPGGITGP
jgi:hypothetical protein